jgi:hypothetical protein
MFDYIEDLEGTGATIMFFHDIRPEMWGEMQHLYFAVTQHIFLLEDVKLVSQPQNPFAGPYFAITLENIANPLNKVYGVDWIQIPTIVGRREPVWASMAADWRGLFTTDEFGDPLDSFSIMDGLESMSDFDVIIYLEKARGHPGVARIIYPLHQDVTWFAICGAEGFPQVAPYIGPGNVYTSGLWGARPAAEYQFLYGGPYSGALAQQDALSMYHLLIIVLIIVGNVAAYAGRKKITEVT